MATNRPGAPSEDQPDYCNLVTNKTLLRTIKEYGFANSQ